MVPREARRFQGDRAGFFTRLLAVGIDFAVVVVILTTLYVAWAVVDFAINPTSFTLPRLTFGLMLVGAAFVAWLDFTVAWSTTGRTLGARVMGIRVVNHQGQVMRPAGAALRAAFCLGFMPGLFWVIVSNANRSLQDTLMRTSVIYDWTKRAPEPQARVLGTNLADQV
jgi:uncharacterized RDD family membrane protein YckC